MSVLENQKKILEGVKRCQRNWDYSKSIPEEHIEHWIQVALNSPSKHYEGFFDLYVFTDRQELEELTEHTWGHTINVDPKINTKETRVEVPAILRNPQVNANCYFLFVRKVPDTTVRYNRDGTERDKDSKNSAINGWIATGMASALVAYSANELGYKTGFCKNHEHPNYPRWLENKLELPDDHQIAFGLGIGYPQEGKSWNRSDEHEILVGFPDWQRFDVIKDDYIEHKGVKYPTSKKPITYAPLSILKPNRGINVYRR